MILSAMLAVRLASAILELLAQGSGLNATNEGAAARAWLATREADLLPVGFLHVVFMLPAEVAAIAFDNKAVVYDSLFRAAAETMLTIAADPRQVGAHVGITAVLHTWGSALTHHPHMHMIVPGGGSAPETRVGSRSSDRWPT